jgi:hypothetical protein
MYLAFRVLRIMAGGNGADSDMGGLSCAKQVPTKLRVIALALNMRMLETGPSPFSTPKFYEISD